MTYSKRHKYSVLFLRLDLRVGRFNMKMKSMPVIILRLADLEQAVFHALPSVLGRAVSAASDRSPLSRVCTAPPGLSDVVKTRGAICAIRACFIPPDAGNHKRMAAKLNGVETRLLITSHGTAATPSRIAYTFSLFVYVVC